MKGTDICPNKICTGCMACANICPQRCIKMTESGTLGHLLPYVDQNACINCGMCKKACPETKRIENTYPKAAFAAWHLEKEQYLTSTSGGAATAFAQTIIKNGGVVYGCTIRDDLKIIHIRVSTEEDINRLKGSKYVQSDVNTTYRDIRKDLNESLVVLFIGTPCQCSGLKSFLRKEYENLYCIDLICHGVPSYKLFKSHIDKVSNGLAHKVSFRKGNDMGLRVFDDHDALIYYSNVWIEKFKDTYYNTFIDGYTYRDSCYTCRYACPKRCSDVTIGDFWGLSEDVENDRVNGCSVVLPITEKGLELVFASPLNLVQRPINEAIAGNSQLRAPKRKDTRIKVFRRLAPFWGVKNSYIICEADNIVNYRLIKPVLRRVKRILKLK